MERNYNPGFFSFKIKCQNCPDPLNSVLQPDIYYGALTEHLTTLMEDYQGYQKKKQRKEFETMIKFKAMQSLCAPGEPVGLLAAQVSFIRCEYLGGGQL